MSTRIYGSTSQKAIILILIIIGQLFETYFRQIPEIKCVMPCAQKHRQQMAPSNQ